MNSFFDQNWTFKQIVDHIGELKQDYQSFLVAFFFIKPSQRTIHIRDYRTKIYSLNLPEWKKNLIWEVLNDDLTIEELQRIAETNN